MKETLEWYEVIDIVEKTKKLYDDVKYLRDLIEELNLECRVLRRVVEKLLAGEKNITMPFLMAQSLFEGSTGESVFPASEPEVLMKLSMEGGLKPVVIKKTLNTPVGDLVLVHNPNKHVEVGVLRPTPDFLRKLGAEA